MEYGSIEREIHVDASPEVVYEVVSSPEHIAQWWSDDAEFESTPGATGQLVFGDGDKVVPMTVVTADPPRVFAFRWCYPEDDVANALLDTFELVSSGAGTTIRLTETGFREMGWEAAQLAEHYQAHVVGWDTHLPRLAKYLVPAR